MSLDLTRRDESRELDEAARRSVAGSFLRLSHGWTHYEIGNAELAPDVILVHGFSAPYFVWDTTFGALVSAGLNPLRYDLYGRGYSDRPAMDYDLELFLGQLVGLVDALGARRAHLVGLSMGGVIAAAFAARYPGRVRRLVLIDPAGVQSLPSRAIYRIAVLPGLGELIVSLVGSGRWISRVAQGFFEAGQGPRMQAEFRAQMEFRGFKRALLSTVREHMLDPMTGVYRELGKLNIPTMLIWGERDRMIPIEHSRLLLALVPRMIFHAIPGCGHAPHYENPERVTPLLLDFLRPAHVSPH